MPTLTRPQRAAVREPADQRLVRERGLPPLAQAWVTSVPVALGDMLAIAIAAMASRTLLVWFGWSTGLTPIRPSMFLHAPLVLALAGLYPPISLNPIQEVSRLTVASAIVFAVLCGAAYVPAAEVSALPFVFVALAWICTIPTLPWMRAAVRWTCSHFPWWGMRAIVVGRGDGARGIVAALGSDRQLALRPVAVLRPGVRRDDLGRYRASWGIFDPESRSHQETADWIRAHTNLVPHMFVVTPLHAGSADVWARPVYNRGLSGVLVESNLLLPGRQLVKRSLSLITALVLSVISLPLIVLIAALVKLSSKGPIFFGHERIGRHGRRFKVWKFRTMVVDADRVLAEHLEWNPQLREEWTMLHKLTDDPRITRFGRFLRKASLDELPQIWNVIRGDMSLVGPRPIVEDEVDKYGDIFDVYTQVTPGLTGLWQVSGRNSTTYDKRVRLDAFYVRNWSIWLDLYVLARTLSVVIRRQGAH